jgi:hypothetical protein
VEAATVSGSALSSSNTFYLTTNGALYYNTAAAQTTNFVFNFASTSGVTLNTLLSTNQSITATVIVNQGATAYYCTAIQIDGTATGVTTYWQGGSAPVAGNASVPDVYSFTIIKTAASTYSIFASLAKF